MKKCSFCAEAIQEEAIKCKHCGEWLTEENKAAVDDSGSNPGALSVNVKPPVPENPEPYNNQLDRQYKGIGGWLTFFILSLTILSPLANVVGINSYQEAMSPYFERVQGLYTVYLINKVSVIVIIVFSLCAGIMLYIMHPNPFAVKFAKTYLMFNLSISIFVIFIPFIVGMPSNIAESLAADAAKNTFKTFVYCGIWYLYLSKSKRVNPRF